MQRQVSDITMDGFPQPVHSLGNADLLKSRTMALLCSIKCPGSVILRIYDLMRDLRKEKVTVVSGFHSPMERECLNILLRGTCGVVLCPARSLPRRVPVEYREPIDTRRMLLLSAFDDKQHRATSAASIQRNRFVAAVSDVIFVPYAAEGGKTEALCREMLDGGKPVFTLQDDHCTNLLALGAEIFARQELE